MIRLLLPGPAGRRTGGNLYDAAIIAWIEGAELVWLEGRFPDPDAAAEATAATALAAHRSATVVVDGLAGLALPVAAYADLWLLVHHPLALETGLDPAQAARLEAMEAARAKAARGLICTSAETAAEIARRWGRTAHVVEPAVERAAFAPVRRRARIVSLGAVTVRKNQAAIVAAAGRAPVTLIGDSRRDAAALRSLRAAIQRHRGRVRVLGERPAMVVDRELRAASLFISASLYEGYGMAIAEAARRGLPVLARAGGASAETARRGGGRVYAGDLARALKPLLRSARLRARLAAQARVRGRRFPDWATQARRFAAILRNG